MKALIFFGYSFFFNSLIHGQQYLFSQLNYSQIIFNPAVTGSGSEVKTLLLNKRLWAGEAGSPLTLAMSLHAPIDHQRMGLGLKVVQDNFFGYRNFILQSLYSYKFKLREGYMSFGISPGLRQYGYQSNYFTPKDPTDPDYINTQRQWWKFDFASGWSYLSDQWLMGLSLQKTFSAPQSLDLKNAYTYYAHLAYLWKRNEQSGIRFSMQARKIVQHYLGEVLVCWEHNKAWTGIGWRTSGNIMCIVGIDMRLLLPAIRHSYKIGYAADINVSAYALSRAIFHEITLMFDLKPIPNKKATKPSGNYLRIL